MPVNLPSPTLDSIIPIPGVRLGTTYAGIRKKEKDDVCVILLDEGCTTAGVFTQNACAAAPVKLCQKHLSATTPTAPIKALLINAGCANAATGEPGFDDALNCCSELAQKINAAPSQVLPFSTGVILERLPMAKMHNGINAAFVSAHALPILAVNASEASQQAHQQAWFKAGNAIMTTDTIAKIVSAQQGEFCATGIAKGAGMIHPNMATMLGFIACNAHITSSVLQTLARNVADDTFNAITIDGDTSTNDSFMIIATGKTGELIDSEHHPRYTQLRSLIFSVADKLAQAIVRDGEGATKFVTINVEGATTRQEAMQVAEKIALSPLVKTAFFASDPNLGRILVAIGNAGIQGLDFSQVDLFINDLKVAEHGGRASSYGVPEEMRALAIMRQDEFSLTVMLNRGQAKARKMTCDYSYDYIKINAEYRT